MATNITVAPNSSYTEEVTGMSGGTVYHSTIIGKQITTDSRGVDKLRKRTEQRVDSWTRNMVPTKVYQKLMEKINAGVPWITVRGSPGEGKTTATYMALKELMGRKRKVFHVFSPEEFSVVTMNCPDPVIMLDDIFGDLEFDQTQWMKWKSTLLAAVGLEEHNSSGSEGKPENRKSATVILVGRDYIFTSASRFMGRFASFVTRNSNLVDLAQIGERDTSEKRDIMKALSSASGVALESSVVERICRIPTPHGFPHVCRLFLTVYKDKTISPESFFKDPLMFLSQTIETLMNSAPNRELFMHILKGNGTVNMEVLSTCPDSFDLMSAAENLTGTYLKKADDDFTFDHPSVYDSVACIIAKVNPFFVIGNCSMSFINQRLQLTTSNHQIQRLTSSDAGFAIFLPKSCSKALAKRFATEIDRNNFLSVLGHRACTDGRFVEDMMSHVSKPIRELVKQKDAKTDENFMMYVASNKSPIFLQYILHKTNMTLYYKDIRTLLQGVCIYAAGDVLRFMVDSSVEFDINEKFQFFGDRPIMIAASTKDAEFVNYIVSLKADVNAKNGLQRTVMHFLCENGLTSVVERIIDDIEDIDAKELAGSTPLAFACESDQLELVQLLVDKGASVKEVSSTVCKTHNLDIIKFLRGKGMEMDELSVLYACEEGSVDVVRYMFETNVLQSVEYELSNPVFAACAGGNVEVINFLAEIGCPMDDEESSAVHASCLHNKPQSVRKLIEIGALVDGKEMGRTPLHTSALQGAKACVIVLVEAGADVNAVDDEGQTPLHKAVYRKNTLDQISLPDISTVAFLLQNGAEINKTDNDDNTPLHLLCSIDEVTPILTSFVFFKSDAKTDKDVFRKLTKLFVDGGADVNMKNKTEVPALRGWCRSLLICKEEPIAPQSITPEPETSRCIVL